MSSTTTRTLTFESNLSDENIKLLLCFVSQEKTVYSTEFPVAWRVKTFRAGSYESFTVRFNDESGVCEAQSGPQDTIGVGSYAPIPCPTPGGGDVVRITNRSGDTSDIGFACVSEINEKGFPVPTITTVFKDVPDKETVVADSSPIIRAYIVQGNVTNYEPTQLIRRDPKSSGSVLLWEKNFRALQSCKIVIDKENGRYIPESWSLPDSQQLQDPQKPQLPRRGDRVYNATLAFPDANAVLKSQRAIAENLFQKGYRVKFVAMEGNSDATMVLTLPSSASCNQAESDINVALASLQSTQNKAVIRSRYATVLEQETPHFILYKTINPTSDNWNKSPKSVTA
ncbi:hypothetical protein NLI96_g6253 [Meripilus lineatus]|uniref:Uncharacterized protein n=1 Tax=Meripilus lineatus TaxID=2056292 RepID=A0AAD5YE25_9APHY|nr:hypothetical protein NLI96_g6253 [Physisporinus lineatus]